MAEKVFEELGFFAEQTCKSLKKVMDGKSFYGCKSYPRCRGIVNVE